MTPCVLISYAHWMANGRRDKSFDRVLEEAPCALRIMVDSGAFTAHQTGAKFDLNKYKEFLSGLRAEYPRHDFEAIQLDVIGDPDASVENFLQMLDCDVPILPVVMRGMTAAQIQVLSSHAKHRFAVGGIAKAATSESVRFLKYLVDSFPAVMSDCHLLGFRRVQHLGWIPHGSVDVSSWSISGQYGGVQALRTISSINPLLLGKRPVDRSVISAWLSAGQTEETICRVLQDSEASRYGGRDLSAFDPRLQIKAGKSGHFILSVISWSVAAVNQKKIIGSDMFFSSTVPAQLGFVVKCIDFLNRRNNE